MPHDFQTPAPARFADPIAVLARACRHFAAPEPLAIGASAERHRVLQNPGGGRSGPWRFDEAPYLRRPMDCLHKDSGYSMVAVMGPSQCGKSEIGNNWLLHTVIYDPADMIFLGPDKDIQRAYSKTQVAPMIKLCPDLAERVAPTVGAENIFQKDFVGCTLFIAWPVASQLRARPVPRWRIDDYDAVPEDIDGEGDAILLLEGRQITFEGYSVGYVNSSPGLGRTRGIEARVAAGTDERWHVPCPHCDTWFALEWERLHFVRDESPDAARESAIVVCPQGCVIEQRDKQATMALGRWVGAGQEIGPSGSVVGELRKTSVASFRFTGLMGFASWGRLAELYRAAEIAFEQSQDEDDLRAFFQSHVGVNYKSRIADAEPVEPSALEARAAASDYALGTVPDWCLCLSAAVDVQGNRFEVEVVGWAPGWESARVDRFPLLALDDGETKVQPSRFPEHWDVLLEKVLRRRYPLAGRPEVSLPILCTAIDTGGLAGVSDNAFAFWARAVKEGVPPTALALVKGGNNPKARLLYQANDVKHKGAKDLPDPELWVPNVNRLKDAIDVRLRREERGAGYMAFPRGFAREHIEELTAEFKSDGVWQRREHRANETLDLEVYNYTAMLRLGGQDHSLAWLPDWAKPRRIAATAAPARLRGGRRPRGRVTDLRG